MTLFSENGFENTTLEQIANRADLHLQTVYRHFASKNELAASIDEGFLRGFQDAFAKRDEDTLRFWRKWIEQSTKEITKQSDQYRKTVVNLFSVPTMSTTYLDTWYQYQETLAEGIAKDMGVRLASNPLPMLIASMLFGGNTYALRRWIKSDGKRNFVKDSLAIVDVVIAEYGDQLTFKKKRKK